MINTRNEMRFPKIKKKLPSHTTNCRRLIRRQKKKKMRHVQAYKSPIARAVNPSVMFNESPKLLYSLQSVFPFAKEIRILGAINKRSLEREKEKEENSLE